MYTVLQILNRVLGGSDNTVRIVIVQDDDALYAVADTAVDCLEVEVAT